MKKKKLSAKSRTKKGKKRIVKKKKNTVDALVKAFLKVYTTPVK